MDGIKSKPDLYVFLKKTNSICSIKSCLIYFKSTVTKASCNY